jgi:2-polyprenyl-3-methyl-5-hydroxy-6-metoxy-1,4-benzoquinol methylase
MMHTNIQAFYERKYTEGSEIPRTSKQYAIDCVPASGGLRVLDVGCGSGLNSKAIAALGHHVSGVDLSEAAIERYRSYGFEGRAADIEEGLNYPNDSFDLVFCAEVIEHMTSPEVLIAEMKRVLKPGGRLVLTTPNSAFWLYRVLGVLGYTVGELQHPKHFQYFSRRSLLKLLESAGLQREEVTGRNMYVILPGRVGPLETILPKLGFRREPRFRTGGHFWHLSNRSRVLNALLADTLIMVMAKPARETVFNQ